MSSRDSQYPPPPGTGGAYAPPGYSGGRSNAQSSLPPRPPRSPPPPPPPIFSAGGGDNYRRAPPSSNGYDNSYPPSTYRDEYRNDRNDRVDRSARNDRNLDRSRDYDYNSYQPPRNSGHSLPPRPSGQDYRGSDSFRPPQGDFSFRVEQPAGIQNPVSFNSRNSRQAQPQGHTRGGTSRGRGGPYYGGRYRGHWSTRAPAAREILRGIGNDKPSEDFIDTENGVVYKPIDDLSDSEEAEMDISDASDNEAGAAGPRAKRVRTLAEAAAGDSVPKWSNPDPYTELPPVEDGEKAKKKDVVHLIRKARVSSVAKLSALPTDADDFIRCDSGDDDDVFDMSGPSAGGIDTGRGVPGAPTGPRTVAPTRSFQQNDRSGRASYATDNASSYAAASFAAPDSAPGQSAALDDQTPQDIRKSKRQRERETIDLTKSSDLGSRKRTCDDELKSQPQARPNKGKKTPVGGWLTHDWELEPGQNPCPWVNDAPLNTPISVRLHMEIFDFYDYVKPRQFEHRLRSDLVASLGRILSNKYPQERICPFGSYMSGLYLPTGDMDLVLCTNRFYNGGAPNTYSKSQMRKFAQFLAKNNVPVGGSLNTILHARVPLVQYIDRVTGLKVDISFENMTGVNAIKTFMAWKEQYPAMPILVTVVKQFLAMRGLNEPVNGGIGGFSVICLVVSFLQLAPQVQSGNLVPEHHLGSMLMEFFDLYGNRFNYTTTAIRLNPPGYIAKVNKATSFAYKNPNQMNKFSIIDPNNAENDIAGGARNTETIVAAFSEAHQDLQERMTSIAQGAKHHSILEVVLGGNYSSFSERRAHLHRLHTNTIGPVRN